MWDGSSTSTLPSPGGDPTPVPRSAFVGRLVLMLGQEGRAGAHLGFTSSCTGLIFPGAKLGAKSQEPGHEPEPLLPVDVGHVTPHGQLPGEAPAG